MSLLFLTINLWVTVYKTMISPLNLSGYEKLFVILVMVFEDGNWGEHLDSSEEKVIRKKGKVSQHVSLFVS